jgi:2-polyprenyl-3-methyl-5-hydroxy-6-metoxy-1,4-benzoquinol methylase
MRPTLKPEGLLEHVALWANLGPLPVAEAMFGMATSRVLMAGARLGIFEELGEGPRSASMIAERRGLSAEGVEHLLDCLAAMGHAVRTNGGYALSRRAKPWLSPKSPTYIGPFLEFNYDQWEWWSGLEEIVKTGRGYEIHEYGTVDPRWERYIRAMFLLSRFSAPEVARKLRLPDQPASLLDLAGGHGWFAAELCLRHPGLHATVLDLPGSARIGRRIIAENGMADRVSHVEGDMMTADLGGPHDAVLCFQIIHHLSPEQNSALFHRIHAALKPGGILAIMDYFTPPEGRRPDSAAFLGLHFFLTSSAATYGANDLKEWLRDAGFKKPRRIRVLRVPVQDVFEARVA